MLSDKMLKEVTSTLRKKTKVKYKVIDSDNPNDISEATLNEFNKYGWELVSVVNCQTNAESKFKMIFKSINEVFVVDE